MKSVQMNIFPVCSCYCYNVEISKEEKKHTKKHTTEEDGLFIFNHLV